MLEQLRGWAPDWLVTFVEGVVSPGVLSALAVVSLLLFAITLVGVPWLVTRVPADYFLHHERGALLRRWVSNPALIFVVQVLKNLFGMVLLIAGIAMLVLPGQGLITLFIATFFLDFPGKTALQRRLLSWKPVHETVNRWRHRRGRAPLRFE